MNALSKSTPAIALLIASIPALAQQPDPLTQFEIKGHVYEPLCLPTGANRHAVLKAAKGHVLAEGVLVDTFGKEP
jgi:hypothetical protein